ncbi:hypothetical protein Psi02_52820 [Planotetraspora silvatica]|uniref:Uncharacterized protein n=1 Tax=Planotetraspora silvatica TaxID=234614 RepID=A0A8J3XTW5_9ACTN|nr:hypothetical protein [Planotetraspora silvatica]GII48858.1 hypothetical protein Psi02_52820 [Planotetraspora silvatica]
MATILKVTQNALMGVVAIALTAGWRPVGVFAAATVVNVVLALGLAALLFGGFSVT